MSDVPTALPPGEQDQTYQTRNDLHPELANAREVAYQLPANARALLRLSFGSAITIATVMVLQDAPVLLPAAKNPGLLALQMTGLWLTVYVLWGLSFWSLGLFAGIIGGGIRIDSEGIRLWRFGKKILWTNIRAICFDEQPAFSAAFFLRPPAARLTLYAEHLPKGKPPGLSGHVIPSFPFSQEEFQSLLGHVCDRTFGFVPTSPRVYVAAESARVELKNANSRGRIKRIAMSALIALGLVAFVGRTATSNYFYNAGNASFQAQNYELARQNFESATKVNPTFSRAFSELARSEFRLGRIADAKKHWECALQLKPDLVEAKAALANIAVREGDFNGARALLRKSIMLQPRYIPGYINLGDLEIRTGNPREAERSLRFVLREEPKNHRAILLMARAKIRQGDLDAAGKFLAAFPPGAVVGDQHLYWLVTAEYLTEKGKLPEANSEFERLESARESGFEEFMARSRYYIRGGNDVAAITMLKQAQSRRPHDAWPLLLQSEIAYRHRQNATGEDLLARATASSVEDPAALVYASKLMASQGKTAKATDLVMRALSLDPQNEEGREALRSLKL